MILPAPDVPEPLRVEDLRHPGVAEYAQVTNPASLAEAGLFVAEGRLVVARLLRSPRFRTRSVLVTDTALRALTDALGTPPSAPAVYVVPQPLMNALVGFNIHRGCLALGLRTPTDEPTLNQLSSRRRLVVLEGVNNPDNVGGLFRSATALGVEGVVLGPGCSDPLYRKAIRTSMAATLQLPFVIAQDWPGALDALRRRGLRLIALTPDTRASPLAAFDHGDDRLALLVGAEGDGLSPAALAAADAHVRIPMTAAVDSLNVTVAASIALYCLRERS